VGRATRASGVVEVCATSHHLIVRGVYMFEPEPYVVSWIQKGRQCADEINCPKRQNKEENHLYVEL